jgi:glutathione S-transferase
MKLYNVIGSGNCRKVLATINHLGIDVDIEHMDFFAGDLAKPEYLAINPNGMVPAFTDGDFSLWEADAIMQYLAGKAPGNSLFPIDPQIRADVVRWQCWELAHYNNAFGTLAFETVLKPQFMQMEPNQPVVEHAKESLARFAAVLEGHLANRDYVVGDGITLADYSIINIEAFKDAIPFAVPHWANTAPESPEAIGRKPNAA